MPFFEHESVRHSAGEYVKGKVRTHEIESFWSMLKLNIRNADIIDQMVALARGRLAAHSYDFYFFCHSAYLSALTVFRPHWVAGGG